jgi:hypothetical protein
MKKALLVLLVSTAVGFTIFTYQHNDPITNNMEFVLSTGNEPGPDLRPHEWAYIKKTYPYYNADSDVYVRALEQANN